MQTSLMVATTSSGSSKGTYSELLFVNNCLALEESASHWACAFATSFWAAAGFAFPCAGAFVFAASLAPALALSLLPALVLSACACFLAAAAAYVLARYLRRRVSLRAVELVPVELVPDVPELARNVPPPILARAPDAVGRDPGQAGCDGPRDDTAVVVATRRAA